MKIGKAALFMGWFLLVPTHIFAADVSSADIYSDSPDLDQWLSQARDAVKNENFVDALAAFTFAYEASDNDVFLFNIAMCLQALERFGEAMAHFERCVQGGNEDVAMRATKAQEALRHKIGRVTLENLRIQSEVLLDGGQTTVENNTLWISPGAHEIQISESGYETGRHLVSVGAGQSVSLNVALVPQPSETTPVLDKPVEMENKPEPGHPKRETNPEEVAVDTLSPVKDKNGISSQSMNDANPALPLSQDGPPNRLPTRRIVGWVTLGTGILTAGIVGGVFTRKYIKDRNEAVAASKNATDAYYNWEPHEQYLEQVDHYNNVALPKNRRGIIIGTTSGGLIAIAGIVILIWDKLKLKKESPLSVAKDGLSFSF